jgi:multimeric flavodoxin WrbA
MFGKSIVILDGTPADNEQMASLLAMLCEILQESGAAVTRFTLRDISLAHCIGCFGCWLESPGICIEADAGRGLTEAVLHSDTTILFTPVTFGGYSSALKKCVDRWLPLAMPYFQKYHGEIHHTPRYVRYPRLVGIGVQDSPDAAEAEIFKTVVGHNAINFHAPSYAADVITASESPELSRRHLRALLSRQDALPFETAIASIMPPPALPEQDPKQVGQAKRALLVIGSPKKKSASTSSVLGGYLTDRLREQGWQSESLTLSASLLKETGKQELLSAAGRADLLILAFPLYIDSLPFLVTRALETIAANRSSAPGSRPRRIFALCNNGFPEARQNAPALAICRQFALQSGMTWAGCLALGAGEALSSGDPLSAAGGNGHPPTRHVMQALDLAAKALADGLPMPVEAQKLLEKSPLPFIPFSLWRWLFAKLGGRNWRQRAAQFGVGKHDMHNRPYSL